MEDDLDSTKNSFDKFMLKMVDLPLTAFIWMSSGMAMDSRELDIAEKEEKMFIFAISLLDTIIWDGGMRERSNYSDIYDIML